MNDNRSFKLTLHMVSSLDGMIAKKDNSVSWFESKDHFEEGVEENAKELNSAIDCFVMGSKTYEHAFELSKNYGWPYGEVPVIVVTHRDLPIDRKKVETFSGDLTKLVEELKHNYTNVWLVGGAILAGEFIRLQLVDDIRLAILPVILGEGRHFFSSFTKEEQLHLRNVTAYKSGMVELCYEVKRVSGI